MRSIDDVDIGNLHNVTVSTGISGLEQEMQRFKSRKKKWMTQFWRIFEVLS